MSLLRKPIVLSFIFMFVLSACIVIVPNSDPPAPSKTPEIITAMPTRTAESASPVPPSIVPASPTPQKTNVPSTQTKVPYLPTPTLKPTLIPTSSPTKPQKVETPPARPYSVQSNNPIYTQNFNHPDKGCNWMGVAGQVFPAKGMPVVNLVVVITGKLGDKTLDLIQLTGLANAYGPGGFEVELSATPVASTKTLSIQLYDLTGKTISDPLTFNTMADCKKNLILINFVQPSSKWWTYIPVLPR
jgi:hypothetical protein